jgi:phosphatidylinositol alpha-1,6-mannosyltransferase
VVATLFLGAQSLEAGNGGIARLARLTARVVGEEMADGRLAVRGFVLSDAHGPAEFGFPVGTARRSRARFVLATHRAALTCSHFLYDFLGMARAHCRLPLLRRPFLTWLCGIDIWEEAPPVRVRTARRADFPVFISAYSRQRAESRHGPFPRGRVCWLGTEFDHPPELARHPQGPPTVLVVGRLQRERDKGHQALIACWPKVVAAAPDARLLIVGGGPDLDAFRDLARSSAAGQRIEVRGFVPDDRMQDLWAEADVFAMPSRGEGFGLVYIEAMRQGLPVIASVHDAAPEINLEGQTGYNVSLDRPIELPERIIELLRDPGLAARLGQNGREHWARHFRYSAFKERFLKLLRPFLEGTP